MSDVSARFKLEYIKLQQRNAYARDLSFWWNSHFKVKVKSFYKGESWRLNEAVRNSKGVLLRRLQELSEKQSRGEANDGEIEVIKSKLMDLEQNRLKNLKEKIAADSITAEEKMTIYHLSRHTHRGSTFGLQLKDDASERLICSNAELGKKIHNYFSEQFKCCIDNSDQTEIDDSLSSICKSLSYQGKKSPLKNYPKH